MHIREVSFRANLAFALEKPSRSSDSNPGPGFGEIYPQPFALRLLLSFRALVHEKPPGSILRRSDLSPCRRFNRLVLLYVLASWRVWNPSLTALVFS